MPDLHYYACTYWTISISQPTSEPTSTPTVDDPEDVDPNCVDIEVKVRTDYYNGETSWQLVDMCTGSIEVEMKRAGQGGDYRSANTLFTNSYCVPPAFYAFNIFDSWGDGICW